MTEHMTPHEQQAKELGVARDLRCAVLTISDTRTFEDDESGDLIIRLLDQAGHLAIHRGLVRDEPDEIDRQLRKWIADPAVNVILTTGGTGVSRRDSTIDVVQRLITTELEGFGELFRMLSWQEVHAAAMLSRAVGGLIVRDALLAPETDGQQQELTDVFIFAMPGSRNAVRTAMKQLIIPQLPHLIWERNR
jgi:molybdopterin adenylyltransferase